MVARADSVNADRAATRGLSDFTHSVLVGDIDDVVPVAASKSVAELFPNSTFVTVANSRHETTGWTNCGSNLANRFIETLSAGDTSCANTPEYIWPALGRFPTLARNARPAAVDSSGTNRISEAERKSRKRRRRCRH